MALRSRGWRIAFFAIALVAVSLASWRLMRKQRDLIPDKGSRPYELDVHRYPADLLGPDSFDIIAYYLLEQHRHWGVERVWAQSMWEACLPVIGDRLSQSRKNLGLEILEHPDEPVPPGRRLQGEGVTLEELVEGGLPDSMVDALVLAYCQLKRNAYLAFLLPRGYDQQAAVRESLKAAGPVIYEKEIRLENRGPRNFVLWTYNFLCDGPHKWVHEEPRATKQIQKRFNKDAPLTVFVFEREAWKKVRRWKLDTRMMKGMSTSALHTPDTHRETVAMAQLLLNNNGIHFLNHSRGLINEELRFLLNDLKRGALQAPYPLESACFDGRGVLAAYGLIEEGGPFPLLDNRDRESITFNPDHHFYFAGLKFAALHTLTAHSPSEDG